MDQGLDKVTESLDTVEKTTLKLLEQGQTVPQISQLLGLNITTVIKELSHKKILNPDATFRNFN